MGEPGRPQGEWQVAVQERLVGQDPPGKGVEHEGIGRVVSHDRDAERRGIGWAWWEWASDFSGVYDPVRKAWVEPLRRALLD